MLEIICVALAVYFESRGESLQGQRAVASVVWNRRDDPRWPSSSCEVVKQPNQFATLFEPTDPHSWQTAVLVAAETENNRTTPAFFFATPGLHNYKYLETIGNHEFFGLEED